MGAFGVTPEGVLQVLQMLLDHRGERDHFETIRHTEAGFKVGHTLLGFLYLSLGRESPNPLGDGLLGRDLLLTHLDEDRKLEPKRVGLFLKAAYALLRNPVKLRANGKVYTYDRRGLSST